MILIDQYAYKSKLKQTESTLKLFFAILTLIVCLFANNLITSLIVLVTMICITVLIGGTPFHIFVKLLIIPLSFLLISVFTLAITITQQSKELLIAISVMNIWIGFSGTGLIIAINLLIKALAAVSCIYFLSLSTPMIDILNTLSKLGVPKLLIEIMELVYRVIFIFIETSYSIYYAQSCRLGYKDIRSSYHSLGTLITKLFIKSFKKADELYTALEARGYDGEINLLLDTYEKNWLGYLLVIVFNAFLIYMTIILK